MGSLAITSVCDRTTGYTPGRQIIQEGGWFCNWIMGRLTRRSVVCCASGQPIHYTVVPTFLLQLRWHATSKNVYFNHPHLMEKAKQITLKLGNEPSKPLKADYKNGNFGTISNNWWYVQGRRCFWSYSLCIEGKIARDTAKILQGIFLEYGRDGWILASITRSWIWAKGCSMQRRQG